MLFSWKHIKTKYTTTLVSLLVLSNVLTLSGFANQNTSQTKPQVNTEWLAKCKRAPKTLAYKKHYLDQLRSKTYYDTPNFKFALSFYSNTIEQSYKANKEQNQKQAFQISSTRDKNFYKYEEVNSSEYEIG